MSKSVLLLKLKSFVSDQPMNINPVEIYYSTQIIEGTKNFSFKACTWKLRRSDGNYRTTNELFNKLQNLSVSGRPLVEFVLYENISFWQFLPVYTWSVIFQAVETIKVVMSVIEEVSPSTIMVFPTYDCNYLIWRKVMESIGGIYNIKIIFLKSNPLIFPRFFKIRFKYFLRQLGIDNSVRKIANAMLDLCTNFIKEESRSERLKNSDAKKIVFVSFDRHWVKEPGGDGRFYDEQIYPLLPALRSAKWSRFIGINCPYSLKSFINTALKRMGDTEPGVSWRSFYTFARLIKTSSVKKKARRIFSDQWKIIENDHCFLSGFEFRKVKLMPIVKKELQRSFIKDLPECAQMPAIAEHILKDERPKVVILTYEAGPYQRALIIAARRMRIPTIGLMHGMIFDNHYDYMYESIIADPEQEPIGFVVPETTCVWGPFWKKILTCFGHYPNDAVSVTGNWRYDKISQILRSINIEKLRQRFRVQPDKKIVLLLTGGLDSVDYLCQCLEAILPSYNVTVLIKPHPDDDFRVIRKLLRKFKLPPSSLIKCSLIEALSISDLVISQLSTAGIEAVLLDREIILADFQKLKGWECYLGSEFLLYANNKDELSEAINRVFNDADVKQKLSLARAQAISDYFFKIDGCAAKRVADILEERIHMNKSHEGIH